VAEKNFIASITDVKKGAKPLNTRTMLNEKYKDLRPKKIRKRK